MASGWRRRVSDGGESLAELIGEKDDEGAATRETGCRQWKVESAAVAHWQRGGVSVGIWRRALP